jgi:hypothetical protein
MIEIRYNEHGRSPFLQRFGETLRTAVSETLTAPATERFVELLKRLDREETQTSNTTNKKD